MSNQAICFLSASQVIQTLRCTNFSAIEPA
uniref:Uncharacterized protein n=1 Tax=Rhizophora mucronata TaxID=61149 RepID=A0A2P2Q6T3_RHIMU